MLFSSSKPDQFKILQAINENKLLQFINFFEYACYKMSWILNAPGRRNLAENNHTHGGVPYLLDKFKLPKKIWDEWILEVEHGFLHGFCTLYFAYHCHHSKQELWDELRWYNMKADERQPPSTFADNLIVSCLLHDVMRHSYDDGHDEKLIELSSVFLPEAYNHSNPKEDSLLVFGDRLELMRYEDHDEWLDYSKLNKAIELYGGYNLIKHFFKHIRPVVKKMFENRYDIWFSHALELPDFEDWNKKNGGDLKPNNLGVSYYPRFHWSACDPGFTEHMKPEYENYFSVHSGRLPFTNCLSHKKSDYGVQGLISFSTVRKYKGKAACAPPSTAGRDHVFVIEHDKIPTKEWLFLYENKNDSREKAESTYSKEYDIDQIEQNDLTAITADLFNGIYRVSELFITNLLCLSCVY